MKYNGQRVDGTHAINGSIFLENRLERFACSFDRDGRRMVEFFAEGRQQNAYLPGRRGGHRGQGSHGGRPDDSGLLRVTGVPSNDILNVRRGPSARSAIVGALANGDRVRNLGCRAEGGSRWCRIQMLDDMRSEGWVNARYLSGDTGASSDGRGMTTKTTLVAQLSAVGLAARINAVLAAVLQTGELPPAEILVEGRVQIVEGACTRSSAIASKHEVEPVAALLTVSCSCVGRSGHGSRSKSEFLAPWLGARPEKPGRSGLLGCPVGQISLG